MPVRVVLADDHLILRQALKALLERDGVRVVADVADGRAAVEAVRRFGPDVAVLDVAMPLLNGVDAAGEISRVAPHTHVLLLSGLDDPRFVPDALRAGVRGFVLKSQGAEDLLRAIEEVQRGGLYVSPGASESVLDAFKGTAPPPPGGTRLSVRERQVVQLVAEGKSTKQIAQVLRISVKTAEFHRGRVMKKLHVHETAGLVRYAIREGLIAP
ncbi:MAG TPA: response regulator transcription factor [Gemmatimonadales bacterium]|jgi:DNA-binding NarL/FixJ family response regulator|nr:response regulator transcription factor [Gemmatimonadales bacterium]